MTHDKDQAMLRRFDCTPTKPATFTLEEQLYAGYFAPKFAFDADSLKDANSKAQCWRRYHGLADTDVRVREATDDETANWLHNEYIEATAAF